MNPLLQQISDHACTDLADLIQSGEVEILAAFHKVASEAQLQEKKLKFPLKFNIIINPDDSTFECDLSWSMKQSLSVSHQIEDPAQEKLALGEQSVPSKKGGITSMTLTGFGKSVTIDSESAKKIADARDKVLAKK